MIRAVPLLLLLILSSSDLEAAAPDSTVADAPRSDSVLDSSWRPLDTLLADGTRFFTDAWELVQMPGGWQAEDWVRLGIISGGATALFVLDNEVREEVGSWSGSDGDAIVDVADHLGHNSVGLLAGGALYLPGLLLDVPWLRRAGLHLTQTLLYSAAIGALLKSTLGRGRPFTGEGPYRFRGPWQQENAWMSLPSGHTVVAFSIASSLAASIDRPWATALLYGGALLTGLGRIYLDQHWSSDVWIGAALTAAIGHGVASLNRPGSSSPSLSVHPSSGGISLALRTGW